MDSCTFVAQSIYDFHRNDNVGMLALLTLLDSVSLHGMD